MKAEDMWKYLEDLQSEENDLLRITADGLVLWNYASVVDHLTWKGYYKIPIIKRLRYMQLRDNVYYEVTFNEIKSAFMEMLNCREYKARRRFLIQNDLFFPPSVLYGLENVNIKEGNPLQFKCTERDPSFWWKGTTNTTQKEE